jgi:hypothetical protein
VPYLSMLASTSSTFTGAPNETQLVANGAGGLSLNASAVAPIRCLTNGAERLRIDATGLVLINTTSAAIGGQVSIVTDGSVHNGISIQNSNPGNSAFYLAFYNSAVGLTGSITQSGATAVLFNTSSDARLKDDSGRARDLSALRGLVVHDFTWRADGARGRGVFAQEVAALFPQAITPGTDETTEDGSLARPWMADYSKFVPDLIAGWQQHDAELAALRAHLATLKGSPS